MKTLLKITCLLVLIIILIELYMISVTHKKILNLETAKIKKSDCILVLGAGIRNKKPSPMLEDRLKTAIKLYEKGYAPKILVSGDHENYNYDEVNVMKDYLKDNGIPSEDIFMDHAGLSTYDSIFRAKSIFETKNIIIVTQKYHLYRALYIAKSLNIKAVGVSADKRRYFGQTKRDIREIIARLKDFIKCIIKPNPTYLGNQISIKGNGDITNDE